MASTYLGGERTNDEVLQDIQSYSYTEMQESPAPIVSTNTPTADNEAQQYDKAIKDENDRLQNINEATWFAGADDWFIGDKLLGAANTFEDTMLMGMYNYAAYDRTFFRPKDENFIKNWDANSVLAFMNQHGVDNKHYNTLKNDAKSLDHALDLVHVLNEGDAKDRQIQNSLTSFERGASTLATGLLDIDTLLSVTGVGIASKLEKVTSLPMDLQEATKLVAKKDAWNKRIAGATALANTGVYMTDYAIKDGASFPEALAMSVIVGGLDSAVIRSMSPKALIQTTEKAEAIGKAIAVRPTEDLVQAFVDDTVAFKAFDQKLPDGTRKLPPPEAEIIEAELAHPELPYHPRTEVKPNAQVLLDNSAVTKMGQIKDEILKDIPDMKVIIRLRKELGQLQKAGAKGIAKGIRTFGDSHLDKVKAFHEKVETIFHTAGTKSIQELNQAIQQGDMIAKQVRNDIYDLSTQINQNIVKITRDIENLTKNDVNVGDEIAGLWQEMHDKGFISKSANEKLQYGIKKGKGEGYTPKIEFKQNGKNKPVDIKINGKKVKKLPFAIAVAMVGATASQASGGDIGEDALNNAGLIILATVFGIGGGLSAYKHLSKHMADGANMSRLATAMDITKISRASVGETFNKLRTSLTETREPLVKATAGSPNARKFVDDMYDDPLTGRTTILNIKDTMFRSLYFPFQGKTHKLYLDWLKETGTSRMDSVLSLFSSAPKRHAFNKMIMEHIEYGKHADSPAIVKASQEVNKVIDKTLERMKASGVKDIDKAMILKNYMPRRIVRDNIIRKLAGATEESKIAFRQAFAQMFTHIDDPLKREEAAKVYLDAILDPLSGFGRKTLSSVDELKNLAKKHGLDEDMMYEIADVLGFAGDTFGRLKKRIPMNKEAFNSVKIKYYDEGMPDGEITLDDVFDQDAMSVIGDLVNSSSGHVALADKGYASVDDALAMLKDIDPDVARGIEKDVGILVGNSAIDYRQRLNKLSRVAGLLTIAKTMPLSMISLASEVAVTAGKMSASGWLGAMKSSAMGFKNTYGEDSMIWQMMGDEGISGFGYHSMSKTFGSYKQVDNLGNITGGMQGIGFVNKMAEIASDAVLHGLQFIKASDFLTKINGADMIQALYNHVNGKVLFKPYEKEAFGLTDDMEKFLKDTLQINDKGYVKAIDLDGMDKDKYNKLMAIIHHMTLKRINHTTMANTPMWARHTAFGSAMSTLLKFSMSSFSNVGSFLGRGMLDGDPQAYTLAALWLGGGAMSYVARSELLGREYTDEDVVRAAIMSTPFMGLYSAGLGVLDSPASRTLNDAGSMLNIMGR